MATELIESDPKDQIVITLHEEDRGALRVRSVDLFISAMKVRFSAPATHGIEHVFHREVGRLIRGICGESTLAKQIINVPDFQMRLRGLAFRGYTLLVHTLESGFRQFIVRLKRVVGNALALFQMSGRTDTGLSLFRSQVLDGPERGGNSNRLFDEMLSNLYLPLVNLNTYLKNTLDGAQPHQPDQLVSSVVQLKTKAELLQFAFDRLITEMMVEKYATPANEDVIEVSYN